MAAQITVGILTYNSAQTIEDTLRSLRAQTLPTSEWSVFFIDHGSDDGTQQILEKFIQQFPNATFRLDPRNNLALSRQWILEKSQTAWVAFVDSDVTLSANWLQTALARANELTPTAGVGAPLLLVPRARQLQALQQIQKNPMGHFYSQQMWIPSKPVQVQHLPTSAALFNRSQVLNAGGFDSDFQHVGEDLELGVRLSKKGETLWILPELLAQHQLTTQSWQDWLTRSFRFGRARLQVLRKHPHLFKTPLSWLPLSLVAALLLLFFFNPILLMGFLLFQFLIFVCLFRSFQIALIVQATQLSYAFGQAFGLLVSK